MISTMEMLQYQPSCAYPVENLSSETGSLIPMGLCGDFPSSKNPF